MQRGSTGSEKIKSSLYVNQVQVTTKLLLNQKKGSIMFESKIFLLKLLPLSDVPKIASKSAKCVS